MSSQNEIFFTSVGCMDGRVQEPIANFGRREFGALYPDTITEAGLVGKLAQEKLPEDLKSEFAFKLLEVSLGLHKSRGIIVHGHQKCAGNPVDDNKHLDDIRQSVERIEQMTKGKVPVIGVFVRETDKGWIVEKVVKTQKA